MSKIVVLSSSALEMQPFLNALPELKKVNVDNVEFYKGKYLDNDVIFGMTGIGMVNAAFVSTLVIEQFKPDLLMFSGVAGGMQPGVKIGDVVIANEVAQAEMSTIMSAVESTPFFECMINPHMRKLPPDWYASAEVANKNINPDAFQVHFGRITSTDQFPAPQVEYARLVDENVLAIDMETAAMYQVAWMKGVKALAVRGISNVLQDDGSDPSMAQADVECAPKRAAEVTLRVIEGVG